MTEQLLAALWQGPAGISIVLTVLAAFLIAAMRPARRKRRKSNFFDAVDPKKQMVHVSRVSFETQRLVNKEEERVLTVLEQLIAEVQPTYRLMAQVSLGEILAPDPKTGTKEQVDLARRSINSKRLDFAIFAANHHLRLAIEYQGSGHYSKPALMRDSVKREAVRKAGVPFLEGKRCEKPSTLRANVLQHIGAAPQHRKTRIDPPLRA